MSSLEPVLCLDLLYDVQSAPIIFSSLPSLLTNLHSSYQALKFQGILEKFQ